MPPYRLAASGSDGWLQIIGVVKDSLDDGLGKPVAPAVFAPFSLLMWPGTQILVRTQGEPLAALRSVRKQVASIDPDQQVGGNARDLEDWIQREPEYARARLITMLFGAFSALAMILAAVGLYGVMSYTVIQRMGELGVRVALGAQRRDVLRIVALSAGTSVGLGLAAGLALSFGLNRMMARFIENGTHDPIVILTVIPASNHGGCTGLPGHPHAALLPSTPWLRCVANSAVSCTGIKPTQSWISSDPSELWATFPLW